MSKLTKLHLEGGIWLWVVDTSRSGEDGMRGAMRIGSFRALQTPGRLARNGTRFVLESPEHCVEGRLRTRE